MDERQMDIKEGAGREESQYDQNFLNWLNKWGNRILWLVLIALGLYLGNQYFGKWQRAGVDRAYAELQDVRLNPTPEALLAIASKHGDTRGIGHMARLAAADQYLERVRTGIVLGAVASPDGTLFSQDDALSDEDRTLYLDQAQTQYQTVYNDTSTKPDLAIHAMGAGFGMGAVAESRGEIDLAGEWYTNVETLATDQGFTDVALHAADMREALADLVLNPRLYQNSELPEPPAPVIPAQPDLSDIDIEQLIRDAQAGLELGPDEGGDVNTEEGADDQSGTDGADDGTADDDTGDGTGEDEDGEDDTGGDGSGGG